MSTQICYFYSLELEKNIVIQYLINNSDVTIKSINLIENKNLSNFISENEVKIENFEINEDNLLTNMIEIIKSYLEGENVNLYETILKLGIKFDFKTYFKTKFTQNIIKELLKVGYGETTSYSELASKLNSKAYRAVGNVMRKNPFPLIVPCHRVIKKNRDLGGFMGSSDDKSALNLKSKLIELEKK